MAKQNKKAAKQTQSNQQKPVDDRWISMRAGITLITLTSIGMGILTAWTSIPIKGTLEGIFWGVAFGAGVWVVFVVALMFNRFLRGKRS